MRFLKYFKFLTKYYAIWEPYIKIDEKTLDKSYKVSNQTKWLI